MGASWKLVAGWKEARCPHDIGRNLFFNHLPLYVYIGRPSSTHVYDPYIIWREIWDRVGSAFRTTQKKLPPRTRGMDPLASVDLFSFRCLSSKAF